MDAAIAEVSEVTIEDLPEAEPEADPVEYVTVKVPVKNINGIHTVTRQMACWTPRQARAQRLIYDGMTYAGEEGHARTLKMGTTAPLWHATAYLLDKVADAYGMDSSELDTLA